MTHWDRIESSFSYAMANDIEVDERVVLLALAHRCNDENAAAMSLDDLAAMTGLSVSRCFDCLQALTGDKGFETAVKIVKPDAGPWVFLLWPRYGEQRAWSEGRLVGLNHIRKGVSEPVPSDREPGR